MSKTLPQFIMGGWGVQIEDEVVFRGHRAGNKWQPREGSRSVPVALKGIVKLISSVPSVKKGHVRFTTVSYKL